MSEVQEWLSNPGDCLPDQQVVEKPGFSRLIRNVQMQGGRHPEE
jgi:hypothetical protein